MTNGALGRRDLFDGRLTNSGTKLIFRIIEGLSWPTRENSGTNLMVHSTLYYKTISERQTNWKTKIIVLIKPQHNFLSK